VISFCCNLIPKNFDHLPEFLAEALAEIKRASSHDPIPDIIRELLHGAPQDAAVDSLGFKNTWLFVTHMVDHAADSVYHSLSTLFPFLDNSQVLVRSHLVGIFGLLLSKDFFKETENETVLKTRDELFSLILERLNDVNAPVRKKVISTLKYVISQKCIPKNYMHHVLVAVSEKAFDVKKSVRLFLSCPRRLYETLTHC
jgi:hypothetical protein